jgi:hypothetical protein
MIIDKPLTRLSLFNGGRFDRPCCLLDLPAAHPAWVKAIHKNGRDRRLFRDGFQLGDRF